jgi:hypothetical protein
MIRCVGLVAHGGGGGGTGEMCTGFWWGNLRKEATWKNWECIGGW